MAVDPFTCRVTIHVVVANPPVTPISSSSTLIRNAEVGNPAADATVIDVCAAVRELRFVVEAPGPTRQT